MAARAFTLRPVPLSDEVDETMARIANDTQVLIDAIANSKNETVKALNDVNVGVARLSADVLNLGKSLDNLSAKVDGIDRDKAPRTDLAAAELRWKESITELRVRTDKDLSAKIGKDEFSVDSFESVILRLDEIEKKTDKIALIDQALNGPEGLVITVKQQNAQIYDLNKFRWKVVGAYGLVAFIASLVGYFLHK